MKQLIKILVTIFTSEFIMGVSYVMFHHGILDGETFFIICVGAMMFGAAVLDDILQENGKIAAKNKK